MLNRLIPLVVLVAVVSVAAVACGGGDSESESETQRSSPSPVPRAPTATAAPALTVTVKPGDGGTAGGSVHVLNHDMAGSGRYAFEPNEFNFKLGETVTFEIRAETEFHTFNVDELDIDESVNGGETVTFSHTFDKAGTFKLFCIPHESLGMVGTIVVQ